MSLKTVILIQYQEIVNAAARQLQGLSLPKEGWLRTTRKAFAMSGAQLARRMGVSRALVSNNERAELSGAVTLKTMRQMAEAMNCRFVYAIVPDEDVEDILEARAKEKAKAYVDQTNTNMALEGQTLSDKQAEFEIERLARTMLENNTSTLWNDS